MLEECHRGEIASSYLDYHVKTNGRNLGTSCANYNTRIHRIDGSNGANDRKREILAAENRQRQE